MGTGATQCRIELLFLIYVAAGAVLHGRGRAGDNQTGTTQTDFSDSATLIGMWLDSALWNFCVFFSCRCSEPITGSRCRPAGWRNAANRLHRLWGVARYVLVIIVAGQLSV